MENKEQAELVMKRLKYYLRQFWVKPTTDNVVVKAAEGFVQSQSNSVLSVLFRTDLQLKQFAQRVIMAFNTNIYWECYNAYQLVEKFIQGEPIYSDTLAPQLLIITYGYNEMMNKQLVPITNQVIAQRQAQGLKTLLLSLKTENQFNPPPVPLITSGTSSRLSEVI